VLPVLAARYDIRLALCGVLLVWPVVFDSSFTVARRLCRGDNVFASHREFLFHRLVACGWSHSAVASLYLTFPLAGALTAFAWQWGGHALHAAVVMVTASLCIGLWFFVITRERKALRLLSVPQTLPAQPSRPAWKRARADPRTKLPA
jgi:hypothetical protein